MEDLRKREIEIEPFDPTYKRDKVQQKEKKLEDKKMNAANAAIDHQTPAEVPTL